MKISILLPTLYPRLAARSIAALRKTSVPLEIVCCGPLPVPEADVFVQAPREGVCKAQRLCYAKATGDMLMLFSDDVIIAAGWGEKAMAAYTDLYTGPNPGSFILNLRSHPVCVCTCFGRAVANFPLLHRSVVETPNPEREWTGVSPDFAPTNLYSEWSDVWLSMSVWERGGCVKRMGEQLVFSPKDVHVNADGLSDAERAQLDRLGCPAPSRNTFTDDCASFLRRFRATVGLGWPADARWWRAFNIDCWPGIVKDDTVNVPDYGDFMRLIDSPPDEGGGLEFAGVMHWRCREHPEVVSKHRLAMPFQCSVMAEITA